MGYIDAWIRKHEGAKQGWRSFLKIDAATHLFYCWYRVTFHDWWGKPHASIVMGNALFENDTLLGVHVTHGGMAVSAVTIRQLFFDKNVLVDTLQLRG